VNLTSGFNGFALLTAEQALVAAIGTKRPVV